MALDTPIILAFDLYGTLLSTSSIAKELAKHFGEDVAGQIATTWRTLQLEYTWRLNSMHRYEPFSTITRRSLGHALRINSKSLDDPAIESVMEAYNSLATFDDVDRALKALASDSTLHPVVFSNGTQDMVSTSVNKSPDLSPYSSVFKDLITIEEPGCFKPAPEVYQHLARKVGKEGRFSEMWLISGNPFDVVGARAIGMQAAWVDREGNGWTDGLIEGEAGRPTVIVKGLDKVVQKVHQFHEKDQR